MGREDAKRHTCDQNQDHAAGALEGHCFQSVSPVTEDAVRGSCVAI